jgi:chlorite dismutase
VFKNAYSKLVNVRNRVDMHFTTLTKAMQTLTDLYAKLLKTVTVKVLKNKYNRNACYEMANILKDSGEGRFFLKQAGARKF